MKIRSMLLTAGLAALIASPVLGAELRGKVVEVGLDTITVQGDDGRMVTFVVPRGVEIRAPEREEVHLRDLQPGQQVTLLVEEPPKAEGDVQRPSEAVEIHIDGDLEVNRE